MRTAYVKRACSAGAAGSLLLGLLCGDAHAQSSVSFGGSASTSNGAEASGASSVSPVPGDTDPSANDAWAERERALGESSTLTGATGLLHMPHAQGGAPGQLRISFISEFFSAGFLCTSEYPCKNPRAAGNVTSDTMDHIGGTLNLNVSILKWLEGYVSTGARANSDHENRPTLLQVVGDTTFGVKGHWALSKVFYLAGYADLLLVNGTGAVGLDGGGTGFRFGPIATLDLRRTEAKTPLRFSLSPSYTLDNTGEVLKDTERDRGQPVTRIERFGLGINRVDHFDIGVGAEVFAAQERVRPFVEYNMLIPSNRQNYLCRPNNISNDDCMANNAVVPSKLTFGSRFFPWKKGFGLTAALDVGITGVGSFVEELSPTPPWTLYLAAGWAIDTQERPSVERIRTVEKATQMRGGKIKGFVHETGKTEGVPTAIVAWENHPELTALATSLDGRFTTQDLPEGPYSFTVKAEGYKDGACSGVVGKAGSQVQIDCALEALPRVGSVVGHVRDAESQAPVPNARVKVVDSQKKELSFGSDGQGNFRGEQVAPGTASFTVEADGYMTLVQPSDLKVRVENSVDLLVRKRPKNPLINVGKSEITLKQQIQFAVDSAVILPESTGLLSEIADAIIRTTRIKRIEIQGHTDNSGTPEHNKILSEQRASAVRDWLTEHGVSGDRLVARGFGQEKPLVPNVTTGNKARNRRVQFIILEQDAAPAAEKMGGTGLPALPGAAKPAAPKPAPEKAPAAPKP
jgi:outer membrane protein OmpA-like peptidoglycan-associated protein